MPRKATYIKIGEDPSPTEIYDELCLTLEKGLKIATVLFLTSYGRKCLQMTLEILSSPISYNFYYLLKAIFQFNLGFFLKRHTLY